jgi:hypothetical protein
MANTGPNCLRESIAFVLQTLGVTAEVPDPTPFFEQPQWLFAYARALVSATGYSFRGINLPAPDDMLWIAALRFEGPEDHAVACRGNTVIYDLLDHFKVVPADRLRMGFELIVPVA